MTFYDSQKKFGDSSGNKSFPPFVPLPRKLWEFLNTGVITKLQYNIMVCLFNHIKDVYVWEVYVSFPLIAKEVYMKRETVRRNCNILKDNGLLSFEMRQGRRSNTKFILLKEPYKSNSYTKNKSIYKEVKYEVLPKVTSNQEKPSLNVTTESSSSDQNMTLPSQKAPNNKYKNKEYIIESLIKLLKRSLNKTELSLLEQDINNYGIKIISKTITLAELKKRKMFNYQYIKTIIPEAENIIKSHSFMENLELEKCNKMEEDKKNADSFEEGLKQIKKMKIKLGYIKPDEEKKNG